MPSLFTASTVDIETLAALRVQWRWQTRAKSKAIGGPFADSHPCVVVVDQREREKFLNRQLWLGRFVDCDLFTTQREKKAGQSCAVRRSNKSFDTLSLSLSMYKRERGNNCDKQDPAGKNRVYTSQWALEFLVGIDDDFVRVKMFICTGKG